MASGRNDWLTVRVATYNVLSPNLCSKGYFKFCPTPDSTTPGKRLKRVVGKIGAEIEKDAVICLQEVSRDWVCELTRVFEEREYTFLHSNYGSAFSGYMGVGVAYPRKRFELVDCKITNLAQTKSGGYSPSTETEDNAASRPDGLLARLGGSWQAIRATVLSILKRVLPFTQNLILPSAAAKMWSDAEGRKNTLVAVRLRHRQQNQQNGEATSGESNARPSAGDEGNDKGKKGKAKTKGRAAQAAPTFMVGTYHMPCAWQTPPVISIHASLMAKWMHKISKGDPFVIAGDLNIRSGSACYELLTKGLCESSEARAEAYPPKPAFQGDTWDIEFAPPLLSAYKEAHGAEPDFTNLARNKFQDEAFIETLDYILFRPDSSSGSARLRVLGADELPHRDSFLSQGILSFPTPEEPSDHVLLAADFAVEPAS